MTNPSGSTTVTGVSLYDPLPAGTTYVTGSGSVTCELNPPSNVRDEFAAAAYNNNNGSVNWAGNWTETDAYGRRDGCHGRLRVGHARPAAVPVPARDRRRPVRERRLQPQRRDGRLERQLDGERSRDDGRPRTPDRRSTSPATRCDSDRATATRSPSARNADRAGAAPPTISFTSVRPPELEDGRAGRRRVLRGRRRADDLSDLRRRHRRLERQRTTYRSHVTGRLDRLRLPADADLQRQRRRHGQSTTSTISSTARAGAAIQRTVNLTGASAPWLTFDQRRRGLVAGDTLVLEASSAARGLHAPGDLRRRDALRGASLRPDAVHLGRPRPSACA